MPLLQVSVIILSKWSIPGRAYKPYTFNYLFRINEKRGKGKKGSCKGSVKIGRITILVVGIVLQIRL